MFHLETVKLYMADSFFIFKNRYVLWYHYVNGERRACNGGDHHKPVLEERFRKGSTTLDGQYGGEVLPRDDAS